MIISSGVVVSPAGEQPSGSSVSANVSPSSSTKLSHTSARIAVVADPSGCEGTCCSCCPCPCSGVAVTLSSGVVRGFPNSSVASWAII